MKKSKTLRVLGIVLAALIVFFAIINIIPAKDNAESNPFLVAENSLPMIAAHRGGGMNEPENTMLAFREAVSTHEADIIESDLYLTKDGYLVYNHDEYIDRTCNVNGDISIDELEAICADESRLHYISDMTLDELKQYNFGYYFEDENGQRIYKDVEDIEAAGLQIATVEALFEEFYQSEPELKFIVEIKNEGEAGKEACRILSETLSRYPEYMDQIVVGTFHDDIEAELKANYPQLLRGAPTGTAAKFILTTFTGTNLFDKSDFACLQIPTSYDLGITLTLDKASIIKQAHERNIAVQYWTINEAEEMRRLIELGCDCIMTDNPALLKQVLDEYR